MQILERIIQRVQRGKWKELEELDKAYWAVESRCGFPPPRRYRYIAGAYDTMTSVQEYEWDSFTAAEAAYEKRSADPEIQALHEKVGEVIESSQREFLLKLE